MRINSPYLAEKAINQKWSKSARLGMPLPHAVIGSYVTDIEQTAMLRRLQITSTPLMKKVKLNVPDCLAIA